MTKKTPNRPRKTTLRGSPGAAVALEATNTADSVLGELTDTLAVSLRALRGEIDDLIAGKAKDNGHDKGSRIAFLSSRMGSIADALRKIQAAQSKAGRDVSPQAVGAYLRGLDGAAWSHLRREIDQHHSGGSVLG